MGQDMGQGAEAGAQGQQEQGSDDKNEENVYDADYKVVDEDEKK